MKNRLSLDYVFRLAGKIENWGNYYYPYNYFGSLGKLIFSISRIVENRSSRLFSSIKIISYTINVNYRDDHCNGKEISYFSRPTDIYVVSYSISPDDPKIKELLEYIEKNIEQQRQDRIKNAAKQQQDKEKRATDYVKDLLKKHVKKDVVWAELLDDLG